MGGGRSALCQITKSIFSKLTDTFHGNQRNAVEDMCTYEQRSTRIKESRKQCRYAVLGSCKLESGVLDSAAVSLDAAVPRSCVSPWLAQSDVF